MNVTVGVISLGCAKNRVDTEQMLGLLRERGYAATPDPRRAQVLIVNTCGFIQSAKEESIDAILEMAAYKKTGACRVLCVTGCLAQRYAQELAHDMPEIDVLLGVSNYGALADAIEAALAGARVCDSARREGFLSCGRVLTTPPYSAYVKIGEGCDNRCAYCAIPLIRGGHRSRPMADILTEMRGLAARGVREQVLVAQDTTRYGTEGGKPSALPELMARAAGIAGIDFLRVLYCYPDETDERLLETMAAHGNICRYLDLPLQHIAPGLLARMNRRGTPEHIAHILTKARAMGFALRTTFIVGFPGEREQDFEELLDFTREMRFDRMGAFAFSPEEDTPAAAMPGQIPEEVKRERLDRLMRLQADISRERNEARVGETARVLVTGRRDGLFTGRSAWEAPDADGEIVFSSASAPEPGEIVRVRLTGAQTYDLTGVAEA